MKDFKLKLLFVCVVLLFGVAPVTLADWNPGNPAKWVQLPDLTPMGIDIAIDNRGNLQRAIGDDFECTMTGPITDVHLWVSWKSDIVGTISGITLRIYSNNPMGPSGFSQPDQLLWSRGFTPAQFTTRLYYTMPTGLYEGWWDPRSGGYIAHGDTKIWQVNINIDPNVAFVQEGSPDNPVIYWLVVEAQLPTTPTTPRLGWKTRDMADGHFMDDAVYRNTPTTPWVELRYPSGHPYFMDSIDMAFVITGRELPHEFDFGDAPEGAVAYPVEGVQGAFPTCMNTGPAGWIQHTNTDLGAYFGPSVDLELEGNAGNCPLFTPNTYNQDECFHDGDAGLMYPSAFTIVGPVGAEQVVPCIQGPNTPLGTVCNTAVWGGNLDIDVHNHMPGATTGYVNVLMDWDRNGQWGGAASGCTAGAVPEHVLVNFPVPNPFDGPLSALLPPNFLIGPYPGHIWTRFTITEVPVPLPWDGSGSFEDGETEDYLLYVEPFIPVTKPLIEHSKWSQPPIEINSASRIPEYSGWDVNSVRELWEPPENWMIVADDFRCLGEMPVTSIHWWGSYYGWELGGGQPPVLPIGWKICFWSNVPANPLIEPGYSYPKKLLQQIEVDAGRVEVNEVGVDSYHGYYPNDICYQYTLNLNPNEWFWQSKFEPNTIDNVFWMSIAALYPNGPLPPYPWGWKTRPWSWMDDAIKFQVMGPLMPGLVLDPYANYMQPIVDPIYQESMDVAFELDTDPCYIKWEQRYTGIRDWPHYEDELSMAETETIVEPITKWHQEPDLSPMGLDVDATWDMWEMYPPQILADDFKCTETGPITDIHIWGSWWHDMLPMGNPTQVIFTLSIHEDIPIGDPRNPFPWSIPGAVQWLRQFGPGQFTVEMAGEAQESYYMPCTGIYTPYDHFMVWKYNFDISEAEAFIQQGDPCHPVVYWLDVQAIPMGESPDIRFGWKTSTVHNIDASVFAVGVEPIPVPGPWQMLMYPPAHPLAGQPFDLAFEITSQKVHEELVLKRRVADDWMCKEKFPVTAMAWWGSYLGYGFEPCSGQFMPLPVKPDYFELTLWDDVPAATVAAGSSNGSAYAYDTAGNLLWSFNTGANVASVDVSADGRYIAVGSQGNKLYLFARDGTELWEKPIPIAYGGWGAGQDSKSVAISARGEYVVAGCTDKLYLYKRDGTLYYSNAGQETCVDISPNGSYIASCNDADGTIHLFINTDTGCTQLWTKTISNAFWIATSDSGYVAVSNRTTVYLYNSAGTQIWSYSNAKWDSDIIRVDMPQDGLSVVAVSDDPGDNKGCILCYLNHLKDGISGWSAADGTPVWTYDPGGLGSDFYSVAISGNGSYITTGGTQGPYLFASTSNVPLQTFGIGNTHQSLDLTDTGFGACGNSQGNLYYFSKDSNIPLWNKALGGNVHAVAVSKGSDQFSHPGDVIWQYRAKDYDEVLVGYDKMPLGEPNEPVFRYSVRLDDPNDWFYQKNVNNIYWLSVMAVYDVNRPNYDWGWTNHQHVFNDDAAAWEMDPTGGLWHWVPLKDQTGETEDMSFILFTVPECFPRYHKDYATWVAVGKPPCWCCQRQCHGDADCLSEYIKGKGYYYVHFKDMNLLLSGWNVRQPPQGPGIAWPDPNICADFGHNTEFVKGKGNYRVHFKDMNILLAYWNVRQPPQGSGVDPNCLDCP